MSSLLSESSLNSFKDDSGSSDDDEETSNKENSGDDPLSKKIRQSEKVK